MLQQIERRRIHLITEGNIMQQLVLIKRFIIKQSTIGQECLSILIDMSAAVPHFGARFALDSCFHYRTIIFVKNQPVSSLLRTKQTKLFLLMTTRTASKKTVVLQI